MARKFLTSIDMVKNEITNLVLHVVAGTPSTPSEGQIWYDSNAKRFKFYNGTAAKAPVLDGGDLTSGSVAISALATDPLARANHTGTQTAATISDFDTQVRTNRLDQMTAPTGSVSMNSQKITGLGTPSADSDAATKLYVDQAVAGLAWKEPAHVATTANITLSGEQTIDSHAVVAGDRVLVKNQSTASQNGVYVVSASAWTRATDADSEAELWGMAIFVQNGGQAGTQWTLTTALPITVGTTSLTYTQFGGSSSYTAGNGLTLTGNDFNVGAGTGISVGSDTVAIDTSVVARHHAASIGNNSDVNLTVTHNLGTRDVVVNVYDNSSYATVECDVVRTDANTVTLSFAVAPTTNQYRVVVVG